MTEPKLIKTNDVMTSKQVRAFYDMGPEEEIEPTISTHNGDWIKEIKDDHGYPFPPEYQWRFWEYEGIHD